MKRFIRCGWYRYVVAVVAAAVAVAALRGTALAHATVIRSVPADGAALETPTRELHIWFDENVAAQFSSARVYDANSQPLDSVGVRGDPADPTVLILTLPTLKPGVHTVFWKAYSVTDGHYSQGLLVLGGAEGSSSAAADLAQSAVALPLPEVMLRWFNLGSLAALIGALAVAYHVLRPFQRRSRQPSAAERAGLRLAQQRVLGWAALSAAFALVVGVAILMWQVSVLRADSPATGAGFVLAWELVGKTRWGFLWLARQGLLLLAGALTLLLYAAARRQAPVSPGVAIQEGDDAAHSPRLARNRVWLAAGVVCVTLAVVQTLTGHAAGVAEHNVLAVIVNTLHILGASLWIGGLLALAVGLLPLMREPGAALALAHAGWSPFSRLAAFSVGLLAATGLYSMGQQVASLDGLLTTLYGQVLVGKVGVVLAAGCIGLLNFMLLHPRWTAPLVRLAGHAGWKQDSRPRPEVRLRRLPLLIGIEAALGLAVLLGTGWLTASPPPRGMEFAVTPDTVPSALSQATGDVVTTLSVKPNRPGENVFQVLSASVLRPPPAEIMRVLLRFSYLERPADAVTVSAEEIEPGRYLLSGNQLSLAGAWRIEVVTRRRGMEDAVAQFDWVVAPPGRLSPARFSKQPWQAPLSVAAAALLLLLPLVMLGEKYARTLRRLRPLPRPPDVALPYVAESQASGDS